MFIKLIVLRRMQNTRVLVESIFDIVKQVLRIFMSFDSVISFLQSCLKKTRCVQVFIYKKNIFSVIYNGEKLKTS